MVTALAYTARHACGGRHDTPWFQPPALNGCTRSCVPGVQQGGTAAQISYTERVRETLSVAGPPMAQRSNHYDAAFEHLLRQQRVPYVRVDETRRALLAEASLKSMDFIVYAPQAQNLLVDVKGRRFGSAGANHRWESWATEEDVRCLRQWEQVFGDGFRAVLVFAYDIVDPRDARRHEGCFEFRGRTYAFYGVGVDDYGAVMQTRSQSWETVWLPAAQFRQLRAPLQSFLSPPSAGDALAHSA